jgi:hypothetical protein
MADDLKPSGLKEAEKQKEAPGSHRLQKRRALGG